MTSNAVDLLEASSLFLYVATPDDIEHERQQMEALYQQIIAVHEVNYPTHSGARCTRVTWKITG